MYSSAQTPFYLLGDNEGNNSVIVSNLSFQGCFVLETDAGIKLEGYLAFSENSHMALL